MSRLRYLPLVLFFITMATCAPEWTSGTDAPPSVGYVMLAFAVTCGIVLARWRPTVHAWIFVLGVIPDIVFTLISYYITGSWEFEGNAWVGTTGCVWIIVPLTLAQWGCWYLIRDLTGGRTFILMSALLRCVALFSHPLLWVCYI